MYMYYPHTAAQCTLHPTRVNFLIGGHSIGIHNGLVASRELVGLEVGGRRVRGGHAIQDGGNCGPTALLREGERGGREGRRERREGGEGGEGELIHVHVHSTCC